MLQRSVHRTFNMLTVDGDMSTNDTVLVLANGLAGNARITEPGPDLEVFEAALTDLFGEMARAMARRRRGRPPAWSRWWWAGRPPRSRRATWPAPSPTRRW